MKGVEPPIVTLNGTYCLFHDQFTFFNCALGVAKKQCLSSEFHCANRVCVLNELVCDLSDDCGDGSDETLALCEEYIRCDFEDAHNPFGIFVHDNTSDFQWSVGKGTTVNQHTGPPFDHTTHTLDGHYLFIASERQQADERAIIATNFLKPSKGKNCHVRFFVHLHGTGVGNLSLFIQ